MARGGNNGGETAEAPAAGTEAGAAATGSSGNDSRFVMVNVPEGDPVTQLANGALTAGPQKRVDYIRALAQTGEWERGAIKNRVNEISPDAQIAYQIVFQATKDIPNVKKAVRATPAAATETAPAAETAPAE
jgi:hypothetical protein